MSNAQKWYVIRVDAVGTTVQAQGFYETSTCTYERTLTLVCRSLTRAEAVGLARKIEACGRITPERWTIDSEEITRTDIQAEIYQECAALYGY